ncbi:MAG: rRNA pseudouridine synthase [Deltaproteobacteria bacterium]|nr:rRNA pseudouridine synthase [Deltaproteobacteria bacterium]
MERIQKILARAGIASRREAERMVIEGRVAVNGKVVDQLGFKADPLKDHIKVDGKRLIRTEPNITLLLNKPKGYLSTVKDPAGRSTVMDLLKGVKWRVYPLGRLDFDAEGLLLLTNDGDLTYHLSHPKFSVSRTYWAKVEGVPEKKELMRLKKGVRLEDGEAKVVSTHILRQMEKHSWVEAVVTEGRNHLVKRIFSAIGHPVLKLKRVGFGPIRLGNLPVGQLRSLTDEEMEDLKKLIAHRMKDNRRETIDERRGTKNVGEAK